ncbi:hypothetical protein H4R35_007362 [Dimargaris xerosporica]|nr:hypothetical protein H4R35_007362 [Dimargaris xerosporica]
MYIGTRKYHPHHSNDRYHGPVLTLLAALTTIGTALAFRVDHLLTADGASSLPNLAWHSPVTASPFVWRLLGVAGMVLGQPRLVQRYPQHHVDVYLALGTAAIMVSTALPHLLRVSTLLLQASPAPTSRQVEQHLAEICSWPNVSGYNHLCLWANAPDEVYCSVEITIEALEQAQDESALLARIVAHLAPCVQHLTVQLNSSDQPRGAQYTD